jgi:hypothetical protein
MFSGMQDAPHILIVDDHRELRDLVSRVLTKEGFRASMAAGAMRQVLADSRIDLILLWLPRRSTRQRSHAVPGWAALSCGTDPRPSSRRTI